MNAFLSRHRQYWSQKRYLHSSLVGLFLFVVSLVANRYSSFYATAQASNPVTDLLLDNLPVMRVEWIVNDVAALFGFSMLFLILWQPRRIPFILKAVALFVFIRSGFIVFTHLAPFPERIYLDPNDLFRTLTYGGDYFFSGHTGMSFLMALIYWQEKRVRYFCLAASALLSVGVILGHLHYSIDVFAAFFITYGVFVMAQRFFPYAYNVFSEGRSMPKLEKTSDFEKAVS
ncbi:MAG: phosphatase PAP2-related protein [Candidatus Moraniibacteriota bacterium]